MVTETRSTARWWIAAVCVLHSVLILLYLFIGGQVRGEEFSPDDFTRRSFSYNLMPLLGITLRGIEYEDSTPVFEQTLYADGFIGKSPANKRWHLIRDNASNPGSPDFDARFLCRFLDLSGKKHESIWIVWNRDHPRLATEFWPIIADLARENLYLDISRIMLKATGVTVETRDSFLEFLRNRASAAFLVLAKEKMAQQDFATATGLFTRSLEISPSKSAYSGRAACHRELGDATLSEQDILAAEELPTESSAEASEPD